MDSLTPKFHSALNEILESLAPHVRVCRWKGEHPYCEGEFNIEQEDINFLKMLKVPAPNFCPTCRRMRRLVNIIYGMMKNKTEYIMPVVPLKEAI